MENKSKWVPDELVKVCPPCQSKFHMFNRRHHCRSCGGVFCWKCSEHRVNLTGQPSGEPVRVCDPCYRALTQRRENSTEQRLSEGSRILYETRSICVHCAIVERRGLKFSGGVAYVVQHNNAIYLYSQCFVHPTPHITLLCSNAPFFHRMLTYLPDPEMGPSMLDQLVCVARTSSTQGSDTYTAPSPLLALPMTVLSPAIPPLPQPLPAPADTFALNSKELYRRLVAPSRSPLLLPLMAELHLCVDGALLSLAELQRQLDKLDSLYPSGAHYLLRLHGGLVPASAIVALNELVAAADAWLNQRTAEDVLLAPLSPAAADAIALSGLAPEDVVAVEAERRAEEERDARACAKAAGYRALVLLDTSFERLRDVALLPTSALLSPRVFPLLRYCLESGQETVCVAEMTEALHALAQFPDLSVAVNVIVAGAPMLAPVLQLLMSRHAQVRIVAFTRHRTPTQAVDASLARHRAVCAAVQQHHTQTQQLPAGASPLAAPVPPVPAASAQARAHPHDVVLALHHWLQSPFYAPPLHDSVDPYPLLNALNAATAGVLSVEHWMPLTAARVLGPLLRKMGLGMFCAYPEPFAAFMSVVIHAGAFPAKRDYTAFGTVAATNLASVFDVQQVLAQSLPIAKQLEAGSSLGLFNAVRLRAAVTQHARADSPVAVSDLLALSPSKNEQARRLRHAQIFILLNAGDVASVDMVRRVRPLSVTLNPDDSSPVTHVSADNGCI